MKFNLMPPVVIVYTDKLPKDWADGWSYGPLILIRPAHKENKGLHVHELFHSAQFWLTLGIHGILYQILPKYRYWSEIWAYRRQLKYSPGSEQRYAEFISTNYKLNVTIDQVLKDLKND
jgi:hypothetical protein